MTIWTKLMTVPGSRFDGSAFPELLPEGRSASPWNEQQILQRVRLLARLLDNQFAIPGTSVRLGWDSLIGLVPGIGDAVTTALSAYLVYLAYQLDVPKSLLRQMILNVAIDFSMGAIPVVGDVMDVAWKSNARNARLLEQYLLKRSSASRAEHSSGWADPV
jgi:hypothetical protein